MSEIDIASRMLDVLSFLSDIPAWQRRLLMHVYTLGHPCIAIKHSSILSFIFYSFLGLCFCIVRPDRAMMLWKISYE